MTDSVWHTFDLDHYFEQRLKGQYKVWRKTTNAGKTRYTIRKIGETPREGDGGYFSMASAFWVKGL